jgi:membrane-bound lytic murein transglycosylase F
MWRKIVKNTPVPMLFVLVGTLSAIVITDISKKRTKPIPTQNKEEVPTSYAISPYDKIFQEVGEKYGIDWLLLVAIARTESQFRFDAVSKAGAIGIMQIMPLVAHNMGYEREALFDIQTNIEIAARLLIENNKMLRLSDNFKKTERLNFILACYNAGYPRIADAIRLAEYHDDEADNWSVVSTYLSLLSEPEFATHEVVHSGIFHGSNETIDYVSKVIHRYNRYRSRIVL